jgi:death on curing protein
MAESFYLTVAEVEQMHRELIDEFGGAHGLRDRAASESAVFRPPNGYYNSLAEEAGALMESLANNHPFIDGNKRIAFSAADTFLARNNFYLDVDADAAYRFMMSALANGTFRFGPLVDWITASIKPLC